jgi:hypothetical protein
MGSFSELYYFKEAIQLPDDFELMIIQQVSER